MEVTLVDKLKQDLEFAEITTAGLHSSRTMWPRAIKALMKAIEALQFCARPTLSRKATEEIDRLGEKACIALAEIEKELNQASVG